MLPSKFVELNEAIEAAGSILMHYFGKHLQLTPKSTRADFRTQADVETENAIIAAIETLFPAYNIVAEEHGAKRKDSAYTFVIDPLDGTNNFVLGIPAFASSVALVKDDEIIYGVVHQPVTGETYFAAKGQGAFRNGQPIAASTEHRPPHSTVSYVCDYTTAKQRVVAFKTALLKLDLKRYLDLWSPAFCYCGLASGRIEAILNDGTELYDFAAGKLIAVEAGARVTDFWGEENAADTNRTFLVTNGSQIHDFLVEKVTRPLAGG